MIDDVEVNEQEGEAEQVEAEQPKTRKQRQPKEEKPESVTVTNMRANPVTIGSKSYKQGEPCVLSAADLANERMMAKVNRLIELGILSK